MIFQGAADSVRCGAYRCVAILASIAFWSGESAQAEIPAVGAVVPFLNAPYAYRYDGPDFNPRSVSDSSIVKKRALNRSSPVSPLDLIPKISIIDQRSSKVVAQYQLDNGFFCDYEDDNCGLDGIFSLIPASSPDQPVLVAITHVGVHGQRVSVFQPLINPREAVFQLTADHALSLRLLPDGLTVQVDSLEQANAVRYERSFWQAGGGPEDACLRGEQVSLPAAPPVSPRSAVVIKNLFALARNRDLNAFMAMLSEDVLVSFGGDGGHQEFVTSWALHTEDGRARFWSELDDLLKIGAWFDVESPQSLVWPWFFSAWPADTDAYDMFFAPDTVVLRAGPHIGSPVIDRLPPSALRFAAPDGEQGVIDWQSVDWVPVAAPGHCLGYVRAEEVRHLLAARMVARNIDGVWMIEAFVAGD